MSSAVDWGNDAVNCIDRRRMLQFLKDRCVPLEAGGGFEVCEGSLVLPTTLLSSTLLEDMYVM